MLHGTIDAHMHYEQTARLAKKMADYKIKNMLLTLPYATHGCEHDLNERSGQQSMYSVERFFKAVIGK